MNTTYSYAALVSNFFFAQSAVFFESLKFCFMKTANKYTGVRKYCGVYKIWRCPSKTRLYTKMLRIHLFCIFIIKTPQALAAHSLSHDVTDNVLDYRTLNISLIWTCITKFKHMLLSGKCWTVFYWNACLMLSLVWAVLMGLYMHC